MEGLASSNYPGAKEVLAMLQQRGLTEARRKAMRTLLSDIENPAPEDGRTPSRPGWSPGSLRRTPDREWKTTMARGFLELRGILDVYRLWPTGGLDVDVTTLRVTTGRGAFRFRPHAGAPLQVTRVFRRAVVVGAGRRMAVDPLGGVLVRLQGIDAPELHYRPRLSWLGPRRAYRQPMAETATRALRAYLSTLGEDRIPCTVTTAVDRPEDAFDSHGRLVGDLGLRIGAGEVVLNRWLLETGWALPAFYSSMSAEEIAAFVRVRCGPGSALVEPPYPHGPASTA